MEKVHGNARIDTEYSSQQEPEDLLVFTVNDIRLGIPAKILDHVVRMVAIIPVPDAPRGVIGIVNYHGEVLPVFSLRVFFSLPEKEPTVSDFLLIIQDTHTVAIIAESVQGVFHPSGEVVPPEQIFQGISGIDGVYRWKDGLLILARPVDFFSSFDKEKLQVLHEILEPL